jgi:hypothetical protein
MELRIVGVLLTFSHSFHIFYVALFTFPPIRKQSQLHEIFIFHCLPGTELIHELSATGKEKKQINEKF